MLQGRQLTLGPQNPHGKPWRLQVRNFGPNSGFNAYFQTKTQGEHSDPPPKKKEKKNSKGEPTIP